MNTLAIRHFLERHLPDFLLLKLKTLYYRKALRSWGVADKSEFKVLQAYIQKGGTCLDVGANIGLYSLIMSELVGCSGRVYAFEPIPNTYKILIENLKYKNCQNVTALNIALSEKNQHLKMIIPNYADGTPAHGEAKIDDSDLAGNGIEVKSARLDDLMGSIEGDISLIKVDIEGHELSFFRGALEALRSARPAVYSEVSNDKKGIFNIFYELDYTPWVILEDGTVKAADEAVKALNFLFVPREKSFDFEANSLKK